MRQKLTRAGCTLVACYMLGLIALGMVANGVAMVILWRWFIVPVFHVQALSIPQALGLCIAIGLFAPSDAEGKSSDKGEHRTVADVLTLATIKVLSRPIMALLFGWIILQFM